MSTNPPRLTLTKYTTSHACYEPIWLFRAYDCSLSLIWASQTNFWWHAYNYDLYSNSLSYHPVHLNFRKSIGKVNTKKNKNDRPRREYLACSLHSLALFSAHFERLMNLMINYLQNIWVNNHKFTIMFQVTVLYQDYIRDIWYQILRGLNKLLYSRILQAEIPLYRFKWNITIRSC